jgi:hypothetical protein
MVGAATLLRIFSAPTDQTNAIAPTGAEEVSEREYRDFIVHLNDKETVAWLTAFVKHRHLNKD